MYKNNNVKNGGQLLGKCLTTAIARHNNMLTNLFFPFNTTSSPTIMSGYHIK